MRLRETPRAGEAAAATSFYSTARIESAGYQLLWPAIEDTSKVATEDAPKVTQVTEVAKEAPQPPASPEGEGEEGSSGRVVPSADAGVGEAPTGEAQERPLGESGSEDELDGGVGELP